MPSRPLPPPPPSQPPHQNPHPLPPPTATVTVAFSLLLLLTACFRKKKRTVPFDSPHRFSYSSLRRAASDFSPSHRLGQGGFGSVYRATLTNPPRDVAVKVMDPTGSLQGEREFHNELSLCSKIDSNYVVSLIGFSSDRKRQRMLLVFELMSNGSLQDCLLRRKCAELMDWRKRFQIAIDVAKGLEYLHHFCNPPIIHSDIKPSNILLDCDFNPKIGDFGLARLKSDNSGAGVEKSGFPELVDDVLVSCPVDVSNEKKEEEFNVVLNQSPQSFDGVTVDAMSPETIRGGANLASPSEDLERGCVLSEGDLDRRSLGSGAGTGNRGGVKRSGRRLKSFSGKDWWWKQDTNDGVVTDYVMEWIGNEIKNERPKNEWVGASSSSIGKSDRKKNRKGLEWWKKMEGEKNVKKKSKEKRRPAREWWKEEYCEELARKQKKKEKKKRNQGSISDCNDGDNWWPVDDYLYTDGKKKKRSRSRGGSMGSVDWWLDKFSGNSHDSGSEGTPKSGCSSTPSMRGTVCYNAPENFGDFETSEKCDVYSFGVVLLVLVSGRRPLQLNGSPVAEYHRANLLSWAKQLARRGRLVDLVDKSVQCLNREQALLCITIALLCLQKLPDRRPSMREVVGMLCGELESPQLPVEFSPSPPSRVPLKSQKKVR
ncbi:hypothetical protein Vadar_027999 [Vaccinium darrowii]|uniref:Uncharacterized protein n=1 Tax=Vaccinium darrowii TaxID=229202 RepID=A0ACB7XKW1_9ERIC|nr:hypothetical protein Vadar_027999 [Vaccinium darrowii]